MQEICDNKAVGIKGILIRNTIKTEAGTFPVSVIRKGDYAVFCFLFPSVACGLFFLSNRLIHK